MIVFILNRKSLINKKVIYLYIDIKADLKFKILTAICKFIEKS